MRLNLCPWRRILSLAHLLATLATAFLKEIKRFKLINNCSCLVLLSLGNMSEIMLIKSVYFPSIDFNMGIFWNYTYIANRLSLATEFRIAASCLLLHWYFHCAGIFPLSLWRRANARNVTLYYPYWQYLHQPFYILICISTLPMQHTTFI